MSEKVIEFECVYGTAKFAGYAYADELDDDDPLHFYDRNLCTQTSLTNAYFSGEPADVQALYNAFTTDVLFLQCLSDFADESKVIQRPGYILKIN